MEKSFKKITILLPVISGILWGSVGVFVRRLNSYGMDKYTILSTRTFIAVLVLLIGILVYDKSLFKIRIRDLWVFVAGGLLGMLGLNFCYNESISRLTLSLAAVLLSLSPIFVMLMAAVLFKEKITLKKTGCMCLAIVGCILSSGVLESNSELNWSVSGIAIGLLSAFFYAMYSVFSKIGMEKGYNVFTITFYSLLINTVVLLPFTNINTVGAYISEAPMGNLVFLFLHSVCTSVLPYVLYTIALTFIETGKASILAAGGEPVAAMLFGLLFFSEKPTVVSVIGLAVTITALALLCRTPKKVQQI